MSAMDILGPYKYVVDVLVVTALVGGVAYGVHRYNDYQQGIGAARVQEAWTAQTAADAAAVRTREIQLQKDKDEAERQAQVRIAAANSAASAAAQSSRVLDSTLKSVLARSSTDSVEANRKYTTALATVFSDCKDQYRSLGREAQGHADDSLKYQQAWPAALGP